MSEPDVARDDQAAEQVLARYPARRVDWPSALSVAGRVDEEAARDSFRGSLLWGAAGDALGRPNEGRSWERIHDRSGPGGLTEFLPWYGWTGGPIGTFTDDTQLTIEVAESLIAAGRAIRLRAAMASRVAGAMVPSRWTCNSIFG